MHSSLNFVTPGDDGRVHFVLDYGWNGTGQRNLPVKLHDMRPEAETLSLDREGFLLDRIDSGVTDFMDVEALESVWKPAVKDMILRVTGGCWAGLFAGPNLRFSESDEKSRSTSISAPARAVHSDLPANFCFDLIERQPLAQEPMREYRELFGGAEPKRWRIFNIWQMITPPPQDTSLALCSLPSVAAGDYVEGKGFFDEPGKAWPDIVAEANPATSFDITFLKENPGQRWCYFSNMQPGEALVFSAFDPKAGPGFARVGHGAVDMPDSGPDANARNSIEIRALVVLQP